MAFFQGFSAKQKLTGFALGLAALATLGFVGNRYIDSTKDQAGSRAGQGQVSKLSNSDGRTFYQSTTTSAPKTKFRPAIGSININTATEQELDQLPGVGPATARKILEYRAQNGGFKSIDELDAVKGIGPKKLAEMRQYCRL